MWEWVTCWSLKQLYLLGYRGRRPPWRGEGCGLSVLKVGEGWRLAGPSAGGSIGQWPWVSDEQSEEAAHSLHPPGPPKPAGHDCVHALGRGDIWRHTYVTNGLGSLRTRGNRLGNPGLLTKSYGGWSALGQIRERHCLVLYLGSNKEKVWRTSLGENRS